MASSLRGQGWAKGKSTMWDAWNWISIRGLHFNPQWAKHRQKGGWMKKCVCVWKKAWFGFSLLTPWKTREKNFLLVWPVVSTGHGFYSVRQYQSLWQPLPFMIDIVDCSEIPTHITTIIIQECQMRFQTEFIPAHAFMNIDETDHLQSQPVHMS